MGGKVIGIKLGMGWAGSQSRQADFLSEARVADGAIKFGEAVTLTSDNKWAPVTSSTTAADIAGIAVREVVQANTFDPQSNPDYLDGSVADVMVRGYCIVKCQRGTPAAGAAVYVRVAENATYEDCVVGGFEATADSTNTIQVPNIEWVTGEVDSNNMAEVTIKTRAKA